MLWQADPVVGLRAEATRLWNFPYAAIEEALLNAVCLRAFKERELTEGRSTGMPKVLKAMAANGSPPPVFETDDDRAAYVIRLPVHPLAQVTATDAQEVTTEVTPEVAPEVTPEVGRLVAALQGEMSRQDLQDALDLRDAKHFREAYLQPSLASGLVAMTQPDAPRSSKQRYRLTGTGRQWLQAHPDGDPK